MNWADDKNVTRDSIRTGGCPSTCRPIHWKVLPGLLVHGQASHEEQLRLKAEWANERVVRRKRTRKERLRVVDPR